MPINDNTRKLMEIFFCYDRKRHQQRAETGALLAHYTTADTAMKIIRGRSMWLRNAAVMNDFSEVEYGRSVMASVLDGILGMRFRDVLDRIAEGAGTSIMERHQGHRRHVRESVFMASLSEYDPRDKYGRLSMWRAYGGPVAGVALLFNGAAADLEIEPSLEVVVSPVLYGDETSFEMEFLELVEKLEANVEFLGKFPHDILVNAGAYALQTASFSIKHPGFEEEKEWRIIHRPYEYASASMVESNICIGGIPQAIYELPFHNPTKGALFDIPQLDLNEILDAVLIGPCAYPETVARALAGEMAAAGIKSPQDRIRLSNIPLRQQW